jgi:anti-sigma regulatory factor (Ser/Thr protein kinase)
VRAIRNLGAAVAESARRPDPTLVLSQDLGEVRRARSFVRQHCNAMGFDAEACDAAILLTSEAVTNAFIHGRSEARIKITAAAGRLYVEVADDNSRHPQRLDQDADALDGRGIAIVQHLASRWGVRDDPYGKTVWFEVAARSRPSV